MQSKVLRELIKNDLGFAMSLHKYIVHGAFEATGIDTQEIYTAPSAQDAQYLANQDGILVTRVEVLVTSGSDDSNISQEDDLDPFAHDIDLESLASAHEHDHEFSDHLHPEDDIEPDTPQSVDLEGLAVDLAAEKEQQHRNEIHLEIEARHRDQLEVSNEVLAQLQAERQRNEELKNEIDHKISGLSEHQRALQQSTQEALNEQGSLLKNYIDRCIRSLIWGAFILAVIIYIFWDDIMPIWNDLFEGLRVNFGN